MHKSSILPVLAALLFGTVGCGTMANLDGSEYALLHIPHQEAPKPFGGVARDVRWIRSGSLGIFCVADVPFSLVGDVVTLPKVLWTMHEGYEVYDFDRPETEPRGGSVVPSSPQTKAHGTDPAAPVETQNSRAN
jgi:hypothetical protein